MRLQEDKGGAIDMSDEIDKEALREEVDRIKEAMGIQERYPDQVKSWILWGSLFGVACLLSQVIALERWPGYLYPVIWFGLMFGGGWPLQVKISREGRAYRKETGTKPSFWIPIVAVMAAAFALVTSTGPFIGDLGYYETGAYFATTILTLIGVYYVVLGNQLKAHYIRKKDRCALYIAGAWMIAVSALIPHYSILMRWMYAIYGATFVAYSLGAYYVLSAR
ncbi:hypothetical protein AKJ66_00080 [candidate division MSBL1 archaeon SCGC-AAA259E22]|uniref:Uncharacterized protein n=1 Tax=candidate division MSBL1 archaeon SCGC-AAA259E22 TaxID=1698265 RepID=A0A133UIK0_9EURY|nr:hypothetical protein AKJ66_00080 [candidate division MSBL1 archaeon SCGC-AAA259E22]